jgi:hypothetical protein
MKKGMASTACWPRGSLGFIEVFERPQKESDSLEEELAGYGRKLVSSNRKPVAFVGSGRVQQP